MARDLNLRHPDDFVSDCSPLSCPPPPPEAHRSISNVLIAVICFLGGCFLLVSYYAVLEKYCSRRRNLARSSETREDFDDENRGQVVDHPIWLINTVGLDQSIISSISVWKYKKGDGLIEGTDCSVCLSEFQEDESLRLLPKCSHAFHLHCIDAWLRSHTNCPLCRAPIVAAAATPNSIETERNSSDLVSRDDSQIEILVGEDGLGRDQSGDSDMVEEERIVDATVVPQKGHEERVEGNEIQPVRRSVSMDSSSLASIFCFSIGNSHPEEKEGSSSASEAIGAKKLNLGTIEKQIGVNQGILRLVSTCSSFKGSSPQKGLVSLKRSFSSGGKFWFSRYSRSNSSIPPL